MLFEKASFRRGAPLMDVQFATWFETLATCREQPALLLDHLCRSFDIHTASLFVYEPRTNLFYLERHVGTEPLKMAISGDFELFAGQHDCDALFSRTDCLQTSSSVASTRLVQFYFSQMHATDAMLITSDKRRIALLHIARPNDAKPTAYWQQLLRSFGAVYALLFGLSALQTENRRLSEVTLIKNEILRNVTHELCTPLNGIMGLCDGIRDDLKHDEPSKRAVDLIHQSASELFKTVQSIIDLAQLEGKRSNQQLAKVSMYDLVHDVAMMFAEVCREKGVALILPQKEVSGVVFGKPDQLHTVLVNLLSNAVKFTHAGQIEIKLHSHAGQVIVTIADTGVGIDPEKLHMIFEEFYQVDGTATRLYGGTGLGLAIVKKIIEQHGGKIWVESKPDDGTQFRFALPLQI